MRLSLGPPARLVFANPTEGLRMVDADRMVTVTKLKDHQDVLGRRARACAAGRARLPACGV